VERARGQGLYNNALSDTTELHSYVSRGEETLGDERLPSCRADP